MSFYKDASLVFLPSGGAGKDGKAYSIKPADGSGDFTFSRGSNLTATRVDSNGLIEKGRENLLLQSNQFDTTWTLSDTSVTSGQSGYDGSSDAWLLNSTATGSPRIQQIVSSSGVSTYSVYAKAATDSFIQLRTFMSPSGDASIWVNLSNGTIVNSSGTAYVTSSVESIGNGWYRCSLTINGSLSYLRMYPASAFGTYSTSGNGVYIQDAQLEQGLVATEPIESGATTGLGGLLEDSPRFDYSGGASCPSLLLEPSRTNVWKYTEYLSYSFSQIVATTITQNTTETLSPEGLYNATKLEGIGSWIFKDFLAGTDTGTWTVSCWVKAVNPSSNNTFRLSVSGNNFSSNLTATNDWQRFYFSVTNGGATAAGLQRDTSANDADLYIYGLQVEEGSYPTSYIPNHSGGSVTREVEDIEQATSSFNIRGDYTFFFEVTRIEGYSSSNSTFITLNNLTDNSILFIYNRDNDKNIRFLIREGSTGGDSIYSPVDSFEIGERVKFCIRKDSTKTEVFFNGSSIGSTTAHKPDGFNNFLSGFKLMTLHQNLVFPSALSDAECITLTS